ncbi:MAG: hypothetical protein JWO32_1555 [Bacteroidetes bacterium]|nr:hypothetical protein [Bacteroidota bacterium]
MSKVQKKEQQVDLATKLKTKTKSVTPVTEFQPTAELQEAINRFIERNEDPKETNEKLFTLLHLAFESPSADMWDNMERSNYFFVYREIVLLIDAVYKAHPKTLII